MTTTHTNCSHAATSAARARCRREARNNSNAPIIARINALHIDLNAAMSEMRVDDVNKIGAEISKLHEQLV
jgi:predicted small metal-binding protein